MVHHNFLSWILLIFTKTKMSSFWWNFHHWLHWKLSKLKLWVQPIMKISSKWLSFHFSELGLLYFLINHPSSPCRPNSTGARPQWVVYFSCPQLLLFCAGSFDCQEHHQIFVGTSAPCLLILKSDAVVHQRSTSCCTNRSLKIWIASNTWHTSI